MMGISKLRSELGGGVDGQEIMQKCPKEVKTSNIWQRDLNIRFGSSKIGSNSVILRTK